MGVGCDSSVSASDATTSFSTVAELISTHCGFADAFFFDLLFEVLVLGGLEAFLSAVEVASLTFFSLLGSTTSTVIGFKVSSAGFLSAIFRFLDGFWFPEVLPFKSGDAIESLKITLSSPKVARLGG